jgi:hypothetical protein
MTTRFGYLMLGLLACKAIPKGSVGDAAVASPAVTDAARPSANAADASAPKPPRVGTWSSVPTGEAMLYPLVDGMCIHGEVALVEGAAILHYGMRFSNEGRGGAVTAAVVTDEGVPVTNGNGLGLAFGDDDPIIIRGEFGGRYPDKLFVWVDHSQSFHNEGEVRFGSASGMEWREVFSGKNPNYPPVAGGGGYSYFAPLRYGDLQLFVVHDSVDGMDRNFRYVAMTLDGEPVPKAKVPEADMAMTFNAVVLQKNQEVLGLNVRDGLLVRWSPKEKVKDLRVKVSSEDDGRIVGGQERVVFQTANTLFSYDGAAVRPLTMAPKLGKSFSWIMGKDDVVFAATPDGTVRVEDRQGAVQEYPPPAGVRRATLAGPTNGTATLSSLWLVETDVRDEKKRALDDRLFRRRTSGWEEQTFAPLPFATKASGPKRFSVRAVDEDDAYVSVVRDERGWGWRQPEPYRAIYRTKRPQEIVRCQDTRSMGTGAGFWSWPPTAVGQAAESCRSPFVVVMRDGPKGPANKYPELARALAKQRDLGDTLSFVNFDARGQSNVGLAAADVPQAEKLAAAIAKQTDLHPEVVCGEPDSVTRRFSFEVAKGVFAFPDAGE